MITGGKFIGKSGHTMQGTFTLTQTDEGMQMVLSEDFFFDAAAPAPVWAMGAPNTTPFPALIEGSIWQKLEPFTPISGKKKILIPKHINAFYHAAIITWCTIINVPMGEGRITQR